MQYTEKDRERFWSHVDRTGECWLWTASKNRLGYASIQIGGRDGRRLSAHRVAWELSIGPIPDGMCVCHRCDVPLCMNPEHLFLGTQKDNLRDMRAKGRSNMQKYPGSMIFYGEKHPNAKLTIEQVQEIRATVGIISNMEWHRRLNISDTLVSAIRLRQAWQHV